MPHTLETLFAPEVDERAVLSVCGVRDDDTKPWRLVHATLLVVPAPCAAVSWGEWRRAQGASFAPELDPLPTELCVTGDGWLLARAVLDLENAETWLAAAIAGDPGVLRSVPGANAVPEVTAAFEQPAALVRALPHIDGRTGSMIAGLGRPADVLLWASAIQRRFPEPQVVDVDGVRSFLPATDLTGIHLTPESVKAELSTPCGLLVGRAERRAWIRMGRGNGDFTGFVADLGWDPTRVMLDELELTYEQMLDGELASAVRLRLEDLDTSAVEGSGMCAIEMPCLGRKVAHGLQLHTTDGELLDRFGPYPIVERVKMTPTINGHEQAPIIVGNTFATELDERLARREKIARDLEQIIRNGVQARIIADRRTALERLKRYIENARGELLVLDRYFGQHVDEWRLLDNVPVPVRVLTGKIAAEQPAIASHVQARFRPKAPLHERVYLWDGGGLGVGSSPSTFGQSPTRFTRLPLAEVEEWQKIFEAEWGSPLYHEVPRKPAV